MAAIMAGNLEHVTSVSAQSSSSSGPEDLLTDDNLRPVTILSLSQSLRKPFETTRRHVRELVRDELCILTPTGIVVPLEQLKSEKVILLESAVWAGFWDMIDRLRSIDFNFSLILGCEFKQATITDERELWKAKNINAPRWLMTRLILEFYVNSIVEATAIHQEDWVVSTVSTAVMSHNSAPWTAKKELAWRHAQADTFPPDDIRAPATVADVVKITGLGRELVRRKLQELIVSGRVEKVDGGYRINMNYMQGPQSRAAAVVVVTAFYRIVYEMTALGVRF